MKTGMNSVLNIKSVGDVISASHRKSWKFTFVLMKYCEFWR